MPDYDGAYHRLFSQPDFVRELLRDVIRPPWLSMIDLSTLERVNIKLHGEGLRGRGVLRREGDMLWRVKRRDGRHVYLFLLLEFQSKDDPWMPLRLIIYVSHVYEHLIQEGLLSRGRLPPIFPIVLYNGRAPWRTPTSLGELIDLPEGSPLRDFQPELSYYLIDQRRYSMEALKAMEAVIPMIIRLERCDDGLEGWKLIEALRGLLERPELAQQRRAVADFLNASEIIPGVELKHQDFHSLLEGGRNMLAENAKRWHEQWKQEGIQLGLQKGLKQGQEKGRRLGLKDGELEGKRQALSHFLEARFGDITPSIQGAIKSISDSDRLTHLTRLAATTPSLADFQDALD